MVYMVAAIYELLGRNVLAVQFVAVMGAATALYLPRRCSCFSNLRVAPPLRIRSSFLPLSASPVLAGIEGWSHRLFPGGLDSRHPEVG